MKYPSLKLRVRRIGNSFGVIIPLDELERLQTTAGDYIEIGELKAWSGRDLADDDLDQLQRAIGLRVLERFNLGEIRKFCIHELEFFFMLGTANRFQKHWNIVLTEGGDEGLLNAMVGRYPTCVRLRVHAPYVGMLSVAERNQIKLSVMAAQAVATKL